jgi:hypothetical protein
LPWQLVVQVAFNHVNSDFLDVSKRDIASNAQPSAKCARVVIVIVVCILYCLATQPTSAIAGRTIPLTEKRRRVPAPTCVFNCLRVSRSIGVSSPPKSYAF